eukprot:363719-Chlamydomonas_euryale.AAC.5
MFCHSTARTLQHIARRISRQRPHTLHTQQTPHPPARGCSLPHARPRCAALAAVHTAQQKRQRRTLNAASPPPPCRAQRRRLTRRRRGAHPRR